MSRIRVLTIGTIPPLYGGKTIGGVHTHLISLYRNMPSYIEKCILATNADEFSMKTSIYQIFDRAFPMMHYVNRFHKLIRTVANLGVLSEQEFVRIIRAAIQLRIYPGILLYNCICYRRALEECNPDLIHTHMIEERTLFAVLMNSEHIPVVTTIHSFNSVKKRDRRQQMIRIIDHNKLVADQFISVSQYVKAEAEQVFSILNNVVIPNGVDTDVFRAYNSSHREIVGKLGLEISENTIVLLFTGNLIERKGVAILIEAFAGVLQYRRGVSLILVGDGPERERLQMLACSHNIEDKVLFVGRRPVTEMVYWYNICDIFIMPSEHEGLSTSMLEAMAIGRPVVVGKPPIGEYDAIVEGETGLYYEYGNVDDLSGKIIRLIEDSNLRKIMGDHARRMVNRHFSVVSSARKTAEIFEDILSGRGQDKAVRTKLPVDGPRNNAGQG